MVIHTVLVAQQYYFHPKPNTPPAFLKTELLSLNTAILPIDGDIRIIKGKLPRWTHFASAAMKCESAEKLVLRIKSQQKWNSCLTGENSDPVLMGPAASGMTLKHLAAR